MVVERECGTGDPWRGSVGRSCVKRFRRGAPDLGGVFERGCCGVPPTGVAKSEDCAGAGGRSTVGVGMRSARTQWSVERSGLGCLLSAEVMLAVEMGVVCSGGKSCVGCGKSRVPDNCVEICLDGCGVVWLIGCLDLNVAEVRARGGLLVFIDHGWGNDEVSLL